MSRPTPRRLKWEPIGLFVLVMSLGLWLAVGPASGPRLDLRPGATTLSVRFVERRGVLEAAPNADGQMTFRLLIAGQEPGRELSIDEASAIFGPGLIQDALKGRQNRLFRVLNITSWTNLVWIGIGLGGQLLFSGRMFLQWLVSERWGRSVITESFWWFSLFGGITLFSYFVWRQDPIGILGQASGIVIYARNLRLIHKQKRREARAAESSRAGAADNPIGSVAK